jgi:hypothetical protein
LVLEDVRVILLRWYFVVHWWFLFVESKPCGALLVYMYICP